MSINICFFLLLSYQKGKKNRKKKEEAREGKREEGIRGEENLKSKISWKPQEAAQKRGRSTRSNDAEMKKREDSFSKSLGNVAEQDGGGLRECRIREDPHALICWLFFF